MSLVDIAKKTIAGWSDFETRSSRREFWIGLVLSFVLAMLVQQVFFVAHDAHPSQLDAAVQSGQGAQADFMLSLLASVCLFCVFMLPLTARRFKDHGWRGGWFRIASYLNFVVAMTVLATLFLSITGRAEAAQTLGTISFLFAFPPYASVIWCLWIGFVKPDPHPNLYGPNPNEVLP